MAQTPAQPTDCILDAPDITTFIESGVLEVNHGWLAGDGLTVIPSTATATPVSTVGNIGTFGPTGVDVSGCGSTATQDNPVDVWYSFTPNGPINGWVDLYRGEVNGQDMVIELYRTVTALGGDCTGEITGEIEYLGCSDQGTGDDLERATCTGLSGERLGLDDPSVVGGTTYYLRIAQWNGTVPALDVDFILIAERSTPIAPAEDNCEDLDQATSADDGVIEATAGCADAAGDRDGRDVTIFYPNQSNAGAFGNSATGATDGTIIGIGPPCVTSGFGTNGSIPTGTPGPATIDTNCNDDTSDDVTSVVINNVINNNVMYAVRLSPCAPAGQPDAIVSIKLDNLEAAPASGTVQITVVGPASGLGDGALAGSDVELCSGLGVGAALFTAAHDVADGTCIEVEATLEVISGTFGLFIEGSNGTLIKWDLTIDIDYLGTCSDQAGPCQSAIAPGVNMSDDGGNNNPMAVELGGFVARAKDKGNELSWTTYNEINNQHFEIERSINGKDYSRIAFVDGKGTTTEDQRYVYFDNKAPAEAYYRLKQVDFNGEYAYSEVLFLSRKNDVLKINSVTPNPAIDEATISFNTNAAGTATVTVTDMFGKLISAKEVATIAGENTELLDLSAQAAGVYFVSVNYGEYSVVKKIMKN